MVPFLIFLSWLGGHPLWAQDVPRLKSDLESDHADHNIRLPFYKPVDDMTGLGQAIRVLMGCPFINGLRARR